MIGENSNHKYEKDNKQILVSAHKGLGKDSQSQVIDKNSLIEAVGMNFDFDTADRFWEAKHGIVVPNMLLTERNTGNRYDNGKYKAIIQHNKFLELVSRMYVVFPNEEVLEIVQNILRDDPDLELVDEPRFTNHNLNLYVVIKSQKHVMKIENSFDGDNDTVNLGCIIRNSLGGGLAFGTDIFTWRNLCQNGAVFGYNELGSDSMRHYGKNSAKITELMRKKINENLNRFTDIHQFYQRMADTKLGEKSSIFKKLELAWFPAKYYPEWVDVELQKIPETSSLSLNNRHNYYYSKDSAQFSLWKVFNDFTASIWKTHDLRMDAKRQMTIQLHKIIIDEANKKAKYN